MPAPRPGRSGSKVVLVAALAALGALPRPVHAGPPYLTDDPEPVEHRGWELYLASQWDPLGTDGAEGSLPHVEANYGVAPGVMLHLLVPAAFVSGGGRTRYGLGDVEVGANVRLVAEGPGRPQLGTFPIATLPVATGGLGEPLVHLFLPLWAMKHLGPWSLDGGGGVELADGALNAQAGLLVQRTLGAATLGAEVFVTAPFDGTPARTQLDLGLVYDLSEASHLLVSGGPSFGAVRGAQAYLAWLVTL